MKAKEARKLLENLSGEELFREATKLYNAELESTIELRAHGKAMTSGIIDSALKQVNDWFLKVTKDLAWSNPKLPNKIIEWERGDIWVKYGIVDSKLIDWSKRTQREIMKGSPLPILEAMKPGDLEAASSHMMARIRKDLSAYEEIIKKRKDFAEKYGLRLCQYCEVERSCLQQVTYSLVEEFPTKTEQLVFICKVDKCIKEVSKC